MMKDKKKRAVVAGVLVGALAAGVKKRQHHDTLHAVHGTPAGLSWSDWKAVLAGTKDAFGRKNISTMAAGVAYYSILAFFPFLAAVVAVAALAITPEQLDTLVGNIEESLPADVSSVVSTQLQDLVSRRSDNILAAGVATAIALFGASGAAKRLVIASNEAYEVRESRGWLAQQAWGFLWTIGGIGFAAVIAALLAVNSTILGHLGFSPFVSELLLYGRWLILLLCAVLGLAIFYRYGPCRPAVRWQWVSWGAVLATAAWLLVTAFFFIYVQNFANYNQSYSLFAGIIILMIWMNLSAIVVLLGAVINYQIEVVSHKKWGGFLA